MFVRLFWVLLSVAVSADSPPQLDAALSQVNSELSCEFEAWLKENNRTYTSPEERDKRYENFARNALLVQQHNGQANNTFTARLNNFADLTADEFGKDRFYDMTRVSTTASPCGQPPKLRLLQAQADLPTSVDWRDCVSPPRIEGDCKPYYAFTVAGALEGAYCAKHGKLVPLSVQQIVNCSGSNGCRGGHMHEVFEWASVEGVCSAEDEPYRDTYWECDWGCTPVMKSSGFEYVEEGDVEAMKRAVAMGPVAAVMDASSPILEFYEGGVYTDAACSTSRPNSVALIVGYGHDDETQKDYWLVQMNWGPGWGEKGYMKLEMSQCGILFMGIYPLVD